MKLNELTLGGYSARGDEVKFSLPDASIGDVAGLNGKTLTVTDDDGSPVDVFEGYTVATVSVRADAINVIFTRKLSDSTAQAIHALEENVRIVRETSAATQAVANEAKEIASQAGTDPQLQALATLQVSTMSFDKVPCDDVVKFVDYWPEWKPDTAYKHNAPLTYQGRKFRASKDLTSQAIYPPGTAESEYYEVTLAPDGIIVWYNVGGEYNMVYKGEKRHYPDADGPVYEALENTSYSPDAYPQHWKKVEGVE